MSTTRDSRRRLAAVLLSILALPSATQGDGLIAYDGFGGGPIADLDGSNGGVGWTSSWHDDSYDIVTSISGGGLEYPGLDTTPGAATSAVGDGIYPMSVYSRSFASVPAGTTALYISFLLRADAGFGIWGGLSTGSYPFKMSMGVPPGMYAYGLMTSEGLGDISNAEVVAGETHLVVIRISKSASGPGTIYRLYLDPVIGQAEPSWADAQFGLGQVGALPTAIRIDNGGGYTTDELRVGLTWSSVLPAAAPPCIGDFDGNGLVDGSDLGTLLGDWGTALADLDGDGTTNGADLGALLGHWGPCP